MKRKKNTNTWCTNGAHSANCQAQAQAQAQKLHKIESQKWGAHSNGLLTKRDKISHLNSTQYVYQRKIDTIAILESAKIQNFYFK